MLYVTTRNNRDAYTSMRALRENRGCDGGLYVPFRLPRMTAEEISALGEKSFCACTADFLNLLFGSRLTSWDVEFCTGRTPVRLAKVSQKILIAECWHNPGGCFDWMASALIAYLRREQPELASGNWAQIGVRIAVIGGVFSELLRCGLASVEQKTDISMVSGDFSGVMSAWYAREMGLPIGSIVCSCNENNNIWNLIHHGQLRTDQIAYSTCTPESDMMLPVGLERLVFSAGGVGEVSRYLEACRRGGTYCPDDRVLEKMRRGLFVSVVSSRRVEATIPSVFGTNSYVLSPYTALAYSGLLDYRAKTGESRYALVLAEKSPLCNAEMTARALGIRENELEHYL